MNFIDDTTLQNAKHWFESMGYNAEIEFDTLYDFDTLYLVLEGFSVEISESEIESRAEQWINKLNRQDQYGK